MPGPNTPDSLDRSAWSARFFSRLHRYQVLMLKRWWVPAICVTLACAVQAYRIWKTPKSFESTGRMIMSVRLQIPEGSAYAEELNNFHGTQMGLMQSYAVTNRAYTNLYARYTNHLAQQPKRIQGTGTVGVVGSVQPPTVGVTTPLPPRTPPEPVPVGLRVSVFPRTSIFVFKATGDEPEYTRAFLDECMQAYIEVKREMLTEKSGNTIQTITNEMAMSLIRLTNAENDIVEWQKAGSNNLVFLQEQTASASSYLVSLNSQLEQLRTESQLLDLLDVDQSLERRDKDSAGSGSPAAGSDTAAATAPGGISSGSDYLRAKQQIQVLKSELADLSQNLRPAHPKIIALKADIARKEKLLEIFRQQSQEQLANRLSSIRLQMQNLESVIKERQTNALDLSIRLADYQRKKAERDRQQSLYDRLVATLQTVDLSKSLNQESVSTLEKATVATAASIDKERSMMLAGLIGLAVGISLLMLLDRLDDRPNSFIELKEQFDEQVLGQVPRIKPSGGAKGRLLPLQADDERHAFAEAYRNLRSSLLFMANDQGRRNKVILVTSAIPSEGKSTVAVNLATTLAFSGSRVLLVDADLRKGLLHEDFGVNSKPGLADALMQNLNWQKAVVPTSIPTLFLLPRGEVPRHPGELLLGNLTELFFREASEQYDYIITDSAPVLATDDTSSLAPRVDGVIFVLRAAYTSARLARNALDALYQRQIRVLGLVFNSVETRSREYYYYKYSDYYHSGKKEKAAE